MGFTEAFQSIRELVSDFKENEKAYLSSDYSEADVRNDFINKFFIALGWDVRHEKQKNPYKQEVRVEKPVAVAKAQKRADYTFYLDPNFRDVKFFVEAKKPAHDINHKDYFFQTVRYGWNANTPLAVLTDFEEFIILDCRFRPDINDILNSKVKSFHYTDYAKEDKFKEIYYLFSRESVSENSLEQFAESLPKPRGKAVQRGLFAGGYQSIDESFLEELDEIRTALAKSFKKNNLKLTSEELTEATQRTIDRLVFIKFLEDKSIEPHHYVSEFGGKRSAWEDFITASSALNAKYNGIVFKKSNIDSKGSVEPDDKTFSKICDDLSHENTPYNFDAIPIHILGSIYERFLGKVVIATDKRVTIDEKPAVRKAGGVYYTPQYIVNYIVDNTIGKLIADKTPKEISKMRFADIACGSGSFLITVYERLLDYHKRWYLDHPEQAKKDGCILYEGAYRLSLQQKRDILTNNIYGVDLDSQAVEVTQLSLYLKLLEDETTATANDTWVMFKEKLLPDLSRNIVNGNSLIGTDILEVNLFNFDEEKKLKPMAFDKVFPEIIKSGGFDAIVGNPPYGADFSRNELKYLRQYFYTAKGELDSYTLFLERTLLLTKKKAFIGLIVPDTWLTLLSADLLRKHLVDNYKFEQLILLNESVFSKVTVDPLILLLKNSKATNNDTTEVVVAQKKVKLKDLNHNFNRFEVNQNEWKSNQNYQIKVFSNNNDLEVLAKLRSVNTKLCDLIEYKAGCKPYEKGKGKPPQTKKTLEEKPFTSHKKLESDWLRLIRGDDIKRYEIRIKKDEWIKYGEWLAAPRDFRIFKEPRLLIQAIRNPSLETRLLATYSDRILISRINVYSFLLRSNKISYNFLLAIINSTLMNWYLKKDYGLHTYIITGVLQIPIFISSSIEQIKKIENLVDQMLKSKIQLQQAKTESDKNYLERKCEQLDKEIDQLVYQLYGLTEEEIKIVENY